MEALTIDPGALRRAYRDITLTLSDTVVHRRNVDGSAAVEICCHLPRRLGNRGTSGDATV
jgi:hypothetical protein